MAVWNAVISIGYTNTLVCLSLSFLAVLVLAAFLHYRFYVYDKRFTELASKIPGPKWYPFIGSTYKFGKNPTDILQNVTDMVEETDKGTNVSRYWLGPILFICLTGVKDIEAILSSNSLITKASVYSLIRRVLGNGLIASTGETWKIHRRLLRPTFAFDALENYVQIFNEKMTIMTEELDTQVGKQSINIYPYIINCVYDILWGSILSTDRNEQVNKLGEEAEFTKMANESVGTTLYRMFKPWLYPDCLFHLTQRGREFKYTTRYARIMMQEVIDRKKRELNPDSSEAGVTDNQSGAEGKTSFLNYVIGNLLDKKLTEKEILEETYTVMAAGLDTTPTALSFILCILSRRFDVQEKIVEEMLKVLGTMEDKDVTSEDLYNLTYLDRVIKECMRILTVIPFVAREITQEVTLPSGYTLPKGCSVLIPFFRLHRDPVIYPDPHVFDPDRFLPDQVAARSTYAYCPFSGGLRDCIAKRYANIQMRIGLVKVLRKFWITPTQGKLEVAGKINLAPVGGVYIGLRRRTAERPVIDGYESLSKLLPLNVSYMNVHFKDSYF